MPPNGTRVMIIASKGDHYAYSASLVLNDKLNSSGYESHLILLDGVAHGTDTLNADTIPLIRDFLEK